jgi:hypothetical protein
MINPAQNTNPSTAMVHREILSLRERGVGLRERRRAKIPSTAGTAAKMRVTIAAG